MIHCKYPAIRLKYRRTHLVDQVRDVKFGLLCAQDNPVLLLLQCVSIQGLVS